VDVNLGILKRGEISSKMEAIKEKRKRGNLFKEKSSNGLMFFFSSIARRYSS